MAKKKTPSKTKAAKTVAAPEPAKPATVKVSAAKGRPMLTWVGKRPLAHVQAFPAQLIERFGKSDTPNLLFHGDNKDVLAWLLANGYRGKVQLVYIDPPFDSGADYVRKVSLRGPKGSMKVDGETYSLGEQIQYSDIWANDNYLQFMYERLLLLRELMGPTGSLCLHCDWHKSHLLRSLADEVFGAENLVNEIIWQRTFSRAASKTINNIHDTLLIYSRAEAVKWNQITLEASEDYIASRFTQVDEGTGERFQGIVLTGLGLSGGATGKPWRGFNPSSQGRHWAHHPDTLDEFDRQGVIYWPTRGGWPRFKRFAKDVKGVALQSIWLDLSPVNSQAHEDTGFPTQKPEELLDRILLCASDPGDLVLDCFIGSGTTAAVAQNLGRRWIGCDINKGALQTTFKRLQAIVTEQSLAAKPAKQGTLLEVQAAPVAGPLGIDVYRVNDYDLQIQHNEAVALACEFLGVQRNRADRYFDGVRGKQLVKIVPFNHPFSPVDLDVLQQELKGRPDEDRDILFVCLGIEMAAKRAVDEWNVHRKGKAGVNKIDVIELRSDPKYGGFLSHSPAKAKISITRKKDTLVIAIDAFISPTIVERLQKQAGVLEPKIDDWRAMVDSVMIDPAYDGATFNVALADVPEKKTDFVEGRYELPASQGKTTVAVKITDMLGEEVVVVATV